MNYDLLTSWSNLQAEFNVGEMWNTEVLLVHYLFLVILVSSANVHWHVIQWFAPAHAKQDPL